MKHTIMCSCGKTAIECKEASKGLNCLIRIAKKEVFDEINKLKVNGGSYSMIDEEDYQQLKECQLPTLP